MTIVKLYRSVFATLTYIKAQISEFDTNITIPTQSEELIALRGLLARGTTEKKGG